MNHNDERDYEEEESNRRHMEREAREEYYTELLDELERYHGFVADSLKRIRRGSSPPPPGIDSVFDAEGNVRSLRAHQMRHRVIVIRVVDDGEFPLHLEN